MLIVDRPSVKMVLISINLFGYQIYYNCWIHLPYTKSLLDELFVLNGLLIKMFSFSSDFDESLVEEFKLHQVSLKSDENQNSFIN